MSALCARLNSCGVSARRGPRRLRRRCLSIVQDLIDDAGELLFAHRSDVHRAPRAGAVEHERRRQLVGVLVREIEFLVVAHDGIRHVVIAHEVEQPVGIDAALIRHDAEDHHLALVALGDLRERRDLVLARLAPRRPEVDDDDLAGKLLGAIRAARGVDVVQGRQAVLAVALAARRRGARPDLDPAVGPTRHRHEQEDDDAGRRREEQTYQRAGAHRNLTNEGNSSVGGRNPMSSIQVAVTFAIPAVAAISGSISYWSDRAGSKMQNGTGLRVWLVFTMGWPVVVRCTRPFLSRWYISSALPWSAVTTRIPPAASTAATRRASCRSTVSTATTVASNTPVCPTMSPLA